ncbi:MAG: biotin-dependent carboxyltransferase family protein [Firmicutes bacterium]|nr:biotin-dependent carboxyltransferase family protein [Bacillota bacterium]
MNPAFYVSNPGLFTTLQDLGRFGYAASGIPQSGALDPYSLRIANILVGNRQDEAALELTILGPRLEFLDNLHFALAGGDLGAQLNGIDLPAFGAYQGQKGDILSFQGGPGVRAYLAVKGGFSASLTLGSKSTYLRAGLGGFAGRPLLREQILYGLTGPKTQGSNPSFLGELPKTMTAEFVDREVPLEVILGPQDDYFAAGQIESFFAQQWQVSSDFDRMGYRLAGEKLEHLDKKEIISDGISPGAIQVPGHGLPIILLADAQTTGGYPKIATVISADLPLLAQRKAEDWVSFSKCNFAQAKQKILAREKTMEEIFELTKIKREVRLFIMQVGQSSYSIRCEEKLGEKLD